MEVMAILIKDEIFGCIKQALWILREQQMKFKSLIMRSETSHTMH